MLGDCDHYASPYMRGVAQAMRLLGHQHAQVSIRDRAKAIEQRIRLWRPDIIWTHMLLWPPVGSPAVSDLLAIVQAAAKRGALVVIHDGDAKAKTRHPHDISDWCALALVNHAYDRSAWGVSLLRWPYFAMTQTKMVSSVDELRCALFFAGTVGGGIYASRSAFLDAIRARGVEIRTPKLGENTIDRTAEIAASADAVLGFGRPEVPGWVDTRVFQYISAGGVLIHDDAGGYFEPWKHYVPYRSGDADSVVEGLRQLTRMSDADKIAMRDRGFTHGQAHHSSVVRCARVLKELRL